MHLKIHDNWDKPSCATDDQVLLMITCMETWIVCDRAVLRQRFGAAPQESALPAASGLEDKSPANLLDALKRATRACETRYEKGTRSFELLARLSPEVLASQPDFARAVRILDRRL